MIDKFTCFESFSNFWKQENKKFAKKHKIYEQISQKIIFYNFRSHAKKYEYIIFKKQLFFLANFRKTYHCWRRHDYGRFIENSLLQCCAHIYKVKDKY